MSVQHLALAGPRSAKKSLGKEQASVQGGISLLLPLLCVDPDVQLSWVKCDDCLTTGL